MRNSYQKIGRSRDRCLFPNCSWDNADRLLSVLAIARDRSDLVILTGGLGPTEDDLTKQTLAQFLGKDLTFDPEAMAKLDRFFDSRPDHVPNSQQSETSSNSNRLNTAPKPDRFGSGRTNRSRGR